MCAGPEIGSVMSVTSAGNAASPAPSARASATPPARAHASSSAVSTPARATALSGNTRATATPTSASRWQRTPLSRGAAALTAASSSG